MSATSTGTTTVLVVDDEPTVREVVAGYLRRDGHAVLEAADGVAAMELFATDPPDLIVLDMMLPGVNGLDILRRVRSASDVPVIMLTARAEESDRVAGLELGADDYVVKPFSADHLEARIRAVLRRSGRLEESSVITVGELELDLDAHEARLAGESLDLTGKEFDLLAYLAQRPGTMVGKRELLAEVWRQPYGGADKTVDVHLSWLRKKLGERAAEPRYLHTKRGVGVKLVPPEQ